MRVNVFPMVLEKTHVFHALVVRMLIFRNGGNVHNVVLDFTVLKEV
jgi:hypothetical protein